MPKRPFSPLVFCRWHAADVEISGPVDRCIANLDFQHVVALFQAVPARTRMGREKRSPSFCPFSVTRAEW